MNGFTTQRQNGHLERRNILCVQSVNFSFFWKILLSAIIVILVFLLLFSREIFPRILSVQDLLPPHVLPTDFHLLLQGMFVGLSVAAPIGPVGIFCMQRTLSKGAWHGLASGLGNALAIALYSAIAGFGVTAASAFLRGRFVTRITRAFLS